MPIAAHLPEARLPEARLPEARLSRGFPLFLAGTALSSTGSAMVPVVLAFALLQAGGGAGRVSAVLGAEALAMALLMLVGGVVADRFAPRRVMIAADMMRAGAQACLAALLLAGAAWFPAMLVLVALVGVGTALDTPGRNRLLTQIVPPDHLPRANGLLMVGTSLAGLLGPAFGGLFMATVGAGWAIALDAASYLVSAVLLLAIRTSASPMPEDGTPSLLRELKEGWHEFRRRRWVWLMVCFFAVLHMLSWAPLEVLGAVDFAHRPAGAPRWGGLLSAMGAGAVLGGLLALRLRPRRPIRAVLLWMLLYPLAPLCLALALPYPAQLVCFCLDGVEMANINVLWESTLQRAIPAERLSRVSAYDAFGSLCLLPVGYALAGPLALMFGVSGALYLGGLLVLGCTLLLLAMPEVRQAEADPITAPGP